MQSPVRPAPPPAGDGGAPDRAGLDLAGDGELEQVALGVVESGGGPSRAGRRVVDPVDGAAAVDGLDERAPAPAVRGVEDLDEGQVLLGQPSSGYCIFKTTRF